MRVASDKALPGRFDAQLIVTPSTKPLQDKAVGGAMRVAYLWQQHGGEWERRPLAADMCLADGGGAGGSGAQSAGAAQVDIIRLVAGGTASLPWALVASPGAHVQVNGRAPVAGLRVLNDRDLISTVDGARYFFV